MGVTALAREVMPRTGTPGALDALEGVLRNGVEVAGSRARMGERGFNGFMERLALADPADPARIVQVIERPPQAQAMQEALAWSLGRRLGVDYLFPAAVLRQDGTAMVQMVPGAISGRAGVMDAADLERVAAQWYQQQMPHLGAEAIAAQARTDRELLTVIDYLLANHDRGNGNLLVDLVDGGFHAVDMGWATGGERLLRATRPKMMQPFTGGANGVLELSPRTVEVIRANLRPDDLRELHASLRSASANYHPTPGASRPQRMLQHSLARFVASDTFLDRMLARHGALLETGTVQYTVPNALARTPVAVAGTVFRSHPVATTAVGVTAAAGGAYAVQR